MVPAVLKKTENNEVFFELQDGSQVTLPSGDSSLSALTRVDPQCLDSSLDDLIHLNSLSEHALLHLLRARFTNNDIYTSVSSILVAVNPFKSLDIYGEEVMEHYRSCKEKSSLPPHIFKTADEVYCGMQATSEPHSVVISGESGAGYVLTCLMNVDLRRCCELLLVTHFLLFIFIEKQKLSNLC